VDDAAQEMMARLLGIALRQARLEAALQLPEAAERSGTTKSHMSQIERGTRLPSITVLIDLCNAYDVLLTDLLEGIYPFGSRTGPGELPPAPADGRTQRTAHRTRDR
jgi:transcriptional regulator with XRE-family HTH domain